MFTCGVKAYRLGQKLDRLNFPISLQPFRKKYNEFDYSVVRVSENKNSVAVFE